ncbi:hypothetical protein EJC49_11265 [Aquibium carbonis]|uniref:Sulfotransferase family protein n=1 Tax=Aquibium carbonis TaxID=2495581 RepID=A0A429YY59_9HYPH|nr:hypothetical protein [Aquibium carbonis]RST86277.1 hypothetical protein EJC49_11265 [Aquibium carbonis]
MGKKIIIHIGLPKTGSSAIQAFLSRNVEALALQGISYPSPESAQVLGAGACTGNLLHVMQRRATADHFSGTVPERVDAYLDVTIEESISTSGTDTVLLSGEFLGAWVTPGRIAALQALSRRHEVLIVAFVRDLYDWQVSGWKQRVKANGETRDLSEYVEAVIEGGGGVLRRLPQFLDSGLDCRLLNYDHHKQALIRAFLHVIGADPDAPELLLEADRLDNPSISYWQATQVGMAVRHTGSSRLAALLLDRFRSEKDPRKDPVIGDVDRRLLEAHREIVSRINRLLPEGHELRRTPREGMALGDVGFSAEDMTRFMQTVRLVLDGPELRPSVDRARQEGLPGDFDPYEYLLRNPDVAAAKVDPAEHYLTYGRFEGRTYRSAIDG